MKIYRIIVKVFAIIFAVSFSIFMLFAPSPHAAINEPVAEEYYDLLKENALKVAKTLDKNALNDETLTADFYFNENELVVTVTSNKANLTAKFPVSSHSLNVENGTLKLQGTVEFKNGTYEEVNKLAPAWCYIVISILAGPAIGYMLYLLFFKIWFPSEKASIK